MATYKYSLTFLDEGGNTAQAEGAVVGADVANATTKIQGIAEALQKEDPAGDESEPSLTLGAVIAASITIPLSISGWDVRGTPVAGSENQKGGRFIWGTVSGYPTRMTIPTFNEFYKSPSGYLLTPGESPAIYQFTNTAVIAGGASDGRGSDISSLREAYFTYGGKPAYK